jgi:hypothetical protein
VPTPNFDGRYGLINHPYLHFGTVTTAVNFAAGVDSGAGTILANGAITVTLPLAAENKGKAFWIKNIAVGAVTIARSGADLIDGATSQSLPDQYDVMLVVSDGVSNWWILSFSNL